MLQQEISVRKLLVSLVVVFALGIAAQAQEFHAAFGFGTVTAPSATTTANGSFPSLSGGLYPSFSGIVIVKHHIGFGGNVAWRASRSLYAGSSGNFGILVPVRPIFYDFDAVYSRTFEKRAGVDLMAGIGGEDLRFYTPYFQCGNFSGCTNYVSSNHFAGHFGAGLRYYFWGHAFIRPEVHYYAIRNNEEYNNANAARFTVSIGYSFLPGF
jgi:Outer membrane protein beta-barrel domain